MRKSARNASDGDPAFFGGRTATALTDVFAPVTRPPNAQRLTVPSPHLGDMDMDEFRRSGHQAIDWIANFIQDVGTRPVFPNVKPGDVKAQLPATPPQTPTKMESILAEFDQIIAPNCTQWNHPSFFGYFPVSASGPAVLAEALAATLSTNAMVWKAAPAATEVEQVTADWMRQMLNLPTEFQGAIMDSASMSTLIAIAAAREQLDIEVRKEGLSGRPTLPKLRLYTSEQAHSSIEKAAIVLGIGQSNVRKIAVDAAFRMIPRALQEAIEDDIAQGMTPFCVVSTAGTTSTASIDPLAEIAAVCREYRLWHHVDGAYGLMAAIAPEFRSLFRGVELADSVVTNPHKWLFNPLECSAFFIKRPDILKRAFSLVPDYLQTSDVHGENYMDWGPQLSRRFRSLKLYMVISYFGQEGLAARLREHVLLASGFACWAQATEGFEVMAPISLATVCFRAHPAGCDGQTELNDFNERLMNAVNHTGKAFLSHTKLHGNYVLRMAIGNIRTEPQHINAICDLLQNITQQLASSR